jgi:alkanesulfonate monooxygenase SsuD/methylene tetrahydromethanopterin reductase-like flavin-dependent oxidoreductase (luciferase family)
MKVGLQVPSFPWPGGPSRLASVLQRIDQTAEEAGFASLWVMDHFFQIEIRSKLRGIDPER